MKTTDMQKARTHNSTYKKLAVQWINEALYFVSSFVVAESLVLRNRQLLVAAKRCAPS
jgi:ribonucleotide reductase beta subunit family protein with ferritin-like domain